MSRGYAMNNLFYNIGFVKGSLESISDNKIFTYEEIQQKLNEMILKLDQIAIQAEELINIEQSDIINNF
jgi:hypothetical protein